MQQVIINTYQNAKTTMFHAKLVTLFMWINILTYVKARIWYYKPMYPKQPNSFNQNSGNRRKILRKWKSIQKMYGLIHNNSSLAPSPRFYFTIYLEYSFLPSPWDKLSLQISRSTAKQMAAKSCTKISAHQSWQRI